MAVEGRVNPGLLLEPRTIVSIKPGMDNKDPWKSRSTGMRCQTCVFYVPKKSSIEGVTEIGRCRRNAPTLKGFPAVFPLDWCGEHRIDEEKLLCG